LLAAFFGLVGLTFEALRWQPHGMNIAIAFAGFYMRKTFKYRLYPMAATQQELLRMQLSESCRLYNAALQEHFGIDGV
jgi:hypothetical protein